MSHSAPRKHAKRACSLYTSPSVSSTLPVYEQLTLTWNPACLTSITGLIDLYLSVQEATGLTVVHEWTEIPYSKGALTTTLQPTWWGAATGAGKVTAQLTITPSGSPVWDTSAPSSPAFTIAYNGTYPASVAAASADPANTGPSVEPSFVPASSFATGKIAAAVSVPLIVIATLVAAYVAWTKYKKRPEQKRWSTAVDHRISIVSQGTWVPPTTPATGRPSGSIHTANRLSQFFADGRPNSSYSVINGATLPSTGSPTGDTTRPLNPPEMRQIGAGDRVSRVSFAGAERPSSSMTRTRNPNSIYEKRGGSMYAVSPPNSSKAGSPIRHSMAAGSPGSPHSSHGHSGSLDSTPTSPSRSPSTKEELANAVFVVTPSPTKAAPGTTSSGPMARPRGHAHQASIASSLRKSYANDDVEEEEAEEAPPLPASPVPSPFAGLTQLTIPAPSHMPMSPSLNSLMSPDEAMQSYATVKRAASFNAGSNVDASAIATVAAAGGKTVFKPTAEGGRKRSGSKGFAGFVGRLRRGTLSGRNENDEQELEEKDESDEEEETIEEEPPVGSKRVSVFDRPVSIIGQPIFVARERSGSDATVSPARPTITTTLTQSTSTVELHSPVLELPVSILTPRPLSILTNGRPQSILTPRPVSILAPRPVSILAPTPRSSSLNAAVPRPTSILTPRSPVAGAVARPVSFVAQPRPSSILARPSFNATRPQSVAVRESISEAEEHIIIIDTPTPDA